MALREIFHWAERSPNRTAILRQGKPISYAVFARAITMARGFFAARGWTGPGFAAIAVSELVDTWVTLLALRSLGLTTIVLRDAPGLSELGLPDLRGVVTSPAEHWPGLHEACAKHGIDHLALALRGETPLPLGEGPDLPWGGHILETSGTTGVAKKVLMEASFEGDYLRRRRELSHIDSQSIVAVFNFHAGTGVGYKAPTNTWIAGGTVVLQQEGDLRETLRLPGLTHATMVPSMLMGVLSTPPDSFPRQPAMTLSITGGTITQAQIDAAKTRIAPNLINGLGATESHTIAVTSLDTPDDHRWHTLAPSSQVEIVNDDGKPVAVGQIGRLRVATAGGPTGYLFDDEATKAFFKDGFFYTGDLAAARADGRIALHGRVTDVINIFGHKIMPAPIEEQLREGLGVGGVCLFSMQDEAGEERLHAVVEAGAPVTRDRLVAAFNQALPGTPDVRIHYVAALPRNAMGKLLRAEAKAKALGWTEPPTPA